MGSETNAATVVKPAKKLGRPPRTFDNPQIVEMLNLLQSGLGRVLVCSKMQVPYKTFQRVMRDNPHEFGRWVRDAEQSRVEGCEAAIYRLAMRGYDSPLVLRAALSYLGRRDKLDEARRARREKRQKAEREDNVPK